MVSCIYEGSVRHRRLSPAAHEFRYRLYMLYLDLDELPNLLAGGFVLSRSWFSPASFRRRDHLGDSSIPLYDAVRDLLKNRTGQQCEGPVRLLTLLRSFGYYFSPLNLYYCFDREGTEVTFIVAEVSNTPWLEKHWYVLWDGNRIDDPTSLRFRHAKDFHVSPFMDMNAEYEWSLSEPGPRLSVSIANYSGDQRFFDVAMVLNRRKLSRGAMIRTLTRHPWMTARVAHAIYWQALRLWWKQCPFYTHPKYTGRQEERQP